MLNRSPRRVRAFTLAELIIVMMIIVLLVAILLPALSSARAKAKKVAAQAQLTSLASACESYVLAFRTPPGYMPESYLGSFSNWPSWTSTENMMLSLLGGITTGTATEAISPAPPSFPSGVSIDVSKVGSGPTTKSGEKYGAFYSPKPDELFNVTGSFTPDNNFPEIVDPMTGQAVLYLRRNRSAASGNLVNSTATAQFNRVANADYFGGNAVVGVDGKARDQIGKSAFSKGAVGGSGPISENNLAWALVNPKISTIGAGNGGANDGNDVAKGEYVLMSAGEDGFYFSVDQLGGTSISSTADLDKFDDLVVGGGG